MEKMGSYFVYQHRGTVGLDCLQYSVSHSQQADEKIQLTATLRLLSHRNLRKIARGQLSQFIDSSRYIREVFFVTKNGRKYLATIFEHQANMQSIGLEDAALSEIECLRLLGEALVLMGQLHRLGTRLGEPLIHYLQIQAPGSGHQKPSVEMIKVDSSQQGQIQGFLEDSHEKQSSGLLDSQEINWLRQFCSLLQKHSKTINANRRWRQIQEVIASAEQRWSGIDLQLLTSTLFTVQISQGGLSLECLLHPLEFELTAYFTDNHKKIRLIYSQQAFMSIQQTNEIISIDKLFYTLASNQPSQIRLLSTCRVSFLNSSYGQWQEVVFRGKGEVSESEESQEDKPGVEWEEESRSQLESRGLNKSFPSNCVVRVIASYSRNNQNRLITGVGFLTQPNLVITCAHLLYYSHKSTSVTPNKVHVVKEGLKIEADYLFPEQFRDNWSGERDYALLYLREEMKVQRYLSIAKNYVQNRKLVIVAQRESRSMRLVRLKYDRSNQSKPRKKLLEHSFITLRGDSGSPLIVQFPRGQFRVMGIHKGIIKESFRLTSAIVGQLVAFEKKLSKSEFSLIERSSVEYDDVVRQMIVQLEKIKNPFSILLPEICQELIGRAIGLRISRGELQKIYLELNAKFSGLMVGWPSQLSMMMGRLFRKEKEQLLQKMESYREGYLIPLLPDLQAESYLSKLNKSIQLLQKDLAYKFDAFQALYQLVCNNYQKFKELRLAWENLAIWHKYYRWEEIYQIQKRFIFSQSQFPQAIQQYLMLSGLQLDKDLTFPQLSRELQLQSITTQDQNMLDSFLSPFKQFHYNGLYEWEQQISLYQYQYTVQLENEQALFDYCWKQIRFVDQRYPLAYLTRLLDEQSDTYVLQIKVKAPVKSTIQQFLPAISKAFFGFFLPFLRFVIDFVCTLHAQGLHLCAPLEYCFLIEQNKKRTGIISRFIYFGHPSALVRKMAEVETQQARSALSEYYPVEEIVAARDSKEREEAFRKIDVWMLGKAFQRYQKRIPQQYYQLPQITWLFQSYREIYKAMTCDSPERCSIVDVKDMLWALADRVESL